MASDALEPDLRAWMGIPFSDEMKQKILEIESDFRERDGRLNISRLAEYFGVQRSTMQGRINVMSREGLLTYKPVMPGFEVASVSTQLDAGGEVQKTYIKQIQARGEQFTPPEGHSIKGVSALVDASGRTVQQWVKTKEPEQDPFAICEAIKGHFADWKPSHTPPKYTPKGIKGLLAFYPVSDLHVGLFSWGQETGENWDLKIARRVILNNYNELFDRTPSTDEAFIQWGGDQQHSDFFSAITEKSGNILDVDGRFPKVLLTLCEMCVEIIYMAKRKHRSINVRILQGNHDRHSAVALAYFLHAWFRNDKAVTIDLSPSLFSVRLFNKTLICGTHGHTIKPRDLPNKIAAAFPREWGNSIFRVCHTYHVHHDAVYEKDYGGMKVESHAIAAPADAYHAAGPYHAFRNIKSITYDGHSGEHGRSTVNIVPAKAKEAA